MHNPHTRFRYSALSLCKGAVAVLTVTYLGLIAVVMSYAALTVEFSQSIRDGESSVAVLEANYLATVAKISATDYRTQGYSVPAVTVFVPAKSSTALR